MFTLDDILTAAGGRLVAGRPTATFRAAAIDSRTVQRGDLFLAFRGQKHGGHGFVLQAFARGAQGALVEALPEGQPWATPAWADEIESHGLRGIEFTVYAAGRQARARMQVLGAHSVHAALAAVAVALHVGMGFDEAVAALRRVEGGVRLLVVEGVQGSTILDDTYNANPASMLAALNLLAEMDGRHVAVLGDMLELGSYEREGHGLVGRRAAATANWLLTVGSRARMIADEARAAGMSGAAVECFESVEGVIERLQDGLRPGDFVLVKGSRGMHLDDVVTAIRVAA